MRKPLIVIVATVWAALACNAPSPADPPPPIGPVTTAASTTAVPSPALALPTLTPNPYIPYTPVFESAPCQFAVPEGYAPECGFVVVPENRYDPATDFIRLHVAVFPCTGGDACQPDPVFHLSGGPGSYSLSIAWYYMNTGHGQFTQTRDYVVYDQRGIGYSQPALECPDSEGFAACRERYVAEGIDLTAYNSAASAADVQDIRAALGYDQINLLGVSYGTRLALTVMRDHPEHIRSVILDSAYPPQVNLYENWAPGAQRALDTLFMACAADPACNDRYPDLANVFYGMVDQLEISPVSVNVDLGGDPVPVAVDGDTLVDALFIGMYRADVIETLPHMIYQVRDGDYSQLAQRLVAFFDRSSSLGMRNSVQCHEEIPFGTFEELLAIGDTVRPQVRYFATRLESLYALCETWGAGTAPAYENEAVFSNLPTLILAGRFDPITPPEWGDLTAETLSRAMVYHFPHAGHWILRSGPCGWTITLAFLNDPNHAPDASCIGQIAGPVFE